MAVQQSTDIPFPISPPDPWPMRFVGLAITGFVLILVFMGIAAKGPSDSPAWNRYVATDCHSPTCLSPRQFITSGQAAWMKRELGGFIVDVRSDGEPAIPLPHAKPDAHVPLMRRGELSAANPITDTPDFVFRIEFANEAEDAIRAANLRDGEPLILVSPSIERSMLAALLLQERGHPRVLILYA